MIAFDSPLSGPHRRAFGKAIRLWHEFQRAAAIECANPSVSPIVPSRDMLVGVMREIQSAASSAGVPMRDLVAAIEAKYTAPLVAAQKVGGPDVTSSEDFEAPACSERCDEFKGHNYGRCHL